MTYQMSEHDIDTVVVGGGQACLAMGYFLAQQDRNFVIIDAVSQVGDVWHSRWVSLRAPRYVRSNGRFGTQLISANPKRNTEQGGR
jgi:cation diffusion facilitator CzcD-associated flavoprotein CzcO